MKVLKEFPKSVRARAGAYDQFLDGKVYELTADDLGSRRNLSELRVSIIFAARHRGIKAKTHIAGDKLFVQAIKK